MCRRKRDRRDTPERAPQSKRWARLLWVKGHPFPHLSLGVPDRPLLQINIIITWVKNNAERDYTNSFPTSHWPWGGSAVAKPYHAKICQTCCYKHCKMRMLCSAGAGHSSSPSSPREHFAVVTGLLLSYALWPLNTDKEWQLQRGILNFGLSYMQHLSPHLVLAFRCWPKPPWCRSTARCSQHWQGWLPLICEAFGVFSLATPFHLRSTRCSKQCRNCSTKRFLHPSL